MVGKMDVILEVKAYQMGMSRGSTKELQNFYHAACSYLPRCESLTKIREKEICGVGPEIYLMQKKLGSGSYGSAYLAKQVRAQESAMVVLKRFEGTDKDSFIQEKQILERVGPLKNIPSLIGFSDLEISPRSGLFVVMEAIDNCKDVKDFIDSSEFKNINIEGFVKDFLTQTSAVLWNLVKVGVTHHDIKPHNILVVPRLGAFRTSYEFYLIDWGVSLTKEQILDGKSLMSGTPYYIDPLTMKFDNEQRSEKKTDEFLKCGDMYSIAISVIQFLLQYCRNKYDGNYAEFCYVLRGIEASMDGEQSSWERAIAHRSNYFVSKIKPWMEEHPDIFVSKLMKLLEPSLYRFPNTYVASNMKWLMSSPSQCRTWKDFFFQADLLGTFKT